jgi:hypothetical protein
VWACSPTPTPIPLPPRDQSDRRNEQQQRDQPRPERGSAGLRGGGTGGRDGRSSAPRKQRPNGERHRLAVSFWMTIRDAHGELDARRARGENHRWNCGGFHHSNTERCLGALMVPGWQQLATGQLAAPRLSSHQSAQASVAISQCCASGAGSDAASYLSGKPRWSATQTRSYPGACSGSRRYFTRATVAAHASRWLARAAVQRGPDTERGEGAPG